MAQTSLTIKYVMNKNGQITVETANVAIDTSRSVGDILRVLPAINPKLGPGSQQLFLPADPGKTLDALGIRAGDTIVVMGKD